MAADPGPQQAASNRPQQPQDLWPPRARRWVMLDLGFGTGQHFLATWQAWRLDPQACEQLVFVATEAQPPSSHLLRQRHSGTALQALAHTLADAWPPLTPNVHLVALEGGRVRLLLALGPTRKLLRQLRLQANAIHLDLTRPPGQADDWHPRQIKTLARLAAADACLSVAGTAPGLGAGLAAAGFVLEPPLAAAARPGDITRARYAPRFPPRHRAASVPKVGGCGATSSPPSSAAANPTAAAQACPSSGPPASTAPYLAPQGVARDASLERHAVIIGAGIAGACCAYALARLGWSCTVLDSQPTPAAGASGNPAALFHGTVHAADGHHARFTRAAALHARHLYKTLIAQGVPGQASGLLRAHALGPTSSLPADWVQRLESMDLMRLAPGLRASSAWFYPGGGWIDPGAAVRALLATPGVRFCGGVHATALVARGAGWAVMDAGGTVCAQGAVVVLANATADPRHASTQALLRSAGASVGPNFQPISQPITGPFTGPFTGSFTEQSAGPITAVRGQVTWFDSPQAPNLPLAGAGYAVDCGPRSMPPGHHRVLCGATSQPGDNDLALRAEDHRHNLERLAQLAGITPAAGTPLHGRCGWREMTPDRLPMAGAAPAAQPGPGARLDQARWVPRVPGLFVLGALAGRGCTWGPLAGEVLAALIDGGPLPLEADLLDAIDPARWRVRQARGQVAGSAGSAEADSASAPRPEVTASPG